MKDNEKLEDVSVEYITKRISEIDAKLFNFARSDIFVFDPEINSLITERNVLQGICPHLMVDGICQYCGFED